MEKTKSVTICGITYNVANIIITNYRNGEKFQFAGVSGIFISSLTVCLYSIKTVTVSTRKKQIRTKLGRNKKIPNQEETYTYQIGLSWPVIVSARLQQHAFVISAPNVEP